MPATIEKPRKTETPVAQPEVWQRPPVQVGDHVLWHCDGDRFAAPSTARVTTVATGTVDLVVDTKDSAVRRFGVHHIDDPSLVMFPDVRKQGAWSESPLTRRMAAIEKRMEELENAVTR